MKKKLTPIITLGILGAFFLLIYGVNVYQKNKLTKGAFTTYATVELLKENQRKGKSGKIDIVYFYFIHNDSVFHKLKQIPVRSISKQKIKLNETFKIKVAKLDYGVFEIEFTERIDTTINNDEYKTQIYNTFIHRNIIE
jgi:hypothetical protein|tara:strand:+ start:2780 stop:3196 length:417 start_codon:yes stop_codon:yes gene_type:complete